MLTHLCVIYATSGELLGKAVLLCKPEWVERPPFYLCLLIDVPVRLNHRVGYRAPRGDRVRGRVLCEALERGQERAKLVAFTDGRERVARLGFDATDGVVAEDSNYVEIARSGLFTLRGGE